MEWMLLPLRRYGEFSGRSCRKEYWLFFLFTIIIGTVADVIDGVLGYGSAGTFRTANAMGAGVSSNGPVGIIVSLGLLVPSLSVAVRRLHDTGRSGWWLLLIFLPILGWIVLLVFYCQDGTRGTNRFGADPKSESLGDVFA